MNRTGPAEPSLMSGAQIAYVANRTVDTAREVAHRFGGEAIALPVDVLRPLLECVAGADDTTRLQERAIRDELARLGVASRLTYNAEKTKAKGVTFIDAPVSGGVRGARNATLAIMAGGDKAAYDKCEPLLKAMGANVFYCGDIGTGNVVKLVFAFSLQ